MATRKSLSVDIVFDFKSLNFLKLLIYLLIILPKLDEKDSDNTNTQTLKPKKNRVSGSGSSSRTRFHNRHFFSLKALVKHIKKKLNKHI